MPPTRLRGLASGRGDNAGQVAVAYRLLAVRERDDRSVDFVELPAVERDA
jgi:hypothetical protein